MERNNTIIGDIAEIFDGPHATPLKTDSGPYYLSISSLKNGFLDLSESAHLSETDFKKWTKRVTPQKGDLLFSYETRLGECALMPGNIRACLGRRMGILRPKTDKIIPEYLLYAYLSPDFQNEIIKNTITGATVDRISISEMSKFQIRVPSVDIQKRIVHVLATLDRAIRKNTSLLQVIEKLIESIFFFWFIQFEFPNKNQEPFLSSGGTLIRNTTLNHNIPINWRLGKIGDLGRIVGGSTPSTKLPQNFTQDGIAWITPYDLSKNLGNKFISHGKQDVTEQGIRNASLSIYPVGTVLMTSRAPVGYLAIARNEITTNQGFKSIIPGKEFSSAFVYYSLKSLMPIIHAHSSGSTFKEISAATFKEIPIVLPEESVIKAFTDLVEPLQKKQDLLEQENAELAKLRGWLLPLLMSGQVTFNEATKL